MTIKHEYHHLKTQLTAEWNCDLNQIRHIAKKCDMRIWAYLPNAKVFEAPNDTITQDDFAAFHESFNQLSDIKLAKLGYTLTLHNKMFTSTKGAITFSLHFNGNDTYSSIMLSNDIADEIAHEGFIQLCEASFMDQNVKMGNLFDLRDTQIIQTYSDNPENSCYLNSIYTISLDNLYVHADEINRIAALLTHGDPPQNPNESTKERDERYQERTKIILSGNPALTKAEIAAQILIEEKNKNNKPPSIERIIKIIQVNRLPQKRKSKSH